jgi:hypothetical protein
VGGVKGAFMSRLGRNETRGWGGDLLGHWGVRVGGLLEDGGAGAGERGSGGAGERGERGERGSRLVEGGTGNTGGWPSIR